MTESRKLFPFVLSSVLCLNLLSPVHENSLNTKYFLDSFLDFHDSVKESRAATLGSRYSWASISHEFFDEPADRQFFSWLQGFRSTGHAHGFLDTSRSKKMLLHFLKMLWTRDLLEQNSSASGCFNGKASGIWTERYGVRSSCSPKVFLFLFCFWHEFSLKLAFEN